MERCHGRAQGACLGRCQVECKHLFYDESDYIFIVLTIFYSFQILKSRRIQFSTAEAQVFIVERLDMSDIVSPLILHHFLDSPRDLD